MVFDFIVVVFLKPYFLCMVILHLKNILFVILVVIYLKSIHICKLGWLTTPPFHIDLRI